MLQTLKEYAAKEGIEVVVVSARVEAELNSLPPEEAAEWLEALGVPGGDGGLGALVRAAYHTLGLRTYFTTGTPLLPYSGCHRTMSQICPLLCQPALGLRFCCVDMSSQGWLHVVRIDVSRRGPSLGCTAYTAVT